MDKRRKEQLILLTLILFLLIMLPKVLLKNKNISRATKKTMINPVKMYALGSAIGRINNIVEQTEAASETVLAEGRNQSLGLLLDTQEYQDSKNKRDLFDMPVELWEKIRLREEELCKKATVRKKKAESLPQNSVGIADLPKVDLLGISWGGKTPLAFIGEKTYKIGDTIEGAEILDINENGVYFFYRGKKVLIKINNQEDAEDGRQNK